MAPPQLSGDAIEAALQSTRARWTYANWTFPNPGPNYPHPTHSFTDDLLRSLERRQELMTPRTTQQSVTDW